MSLQCRRCWHRFPADETFVIGYHQRDGMKWMYLCGECTDSLKSWMGVRPEAPEPEVPRAPVTLYFED